ncbi:leucyl aminopeptidase family protein [Thermoflavimicrobium dichotomicum]|uniref:Probable cytosol aminopeptidase n=1 Tax=Thermoflavimicrobium dichotomicum TaxID=46223 RepID=A0A1I3NA06_9BACL|nr:M17 family peptidase N-terminal domain-containing protein [Thermoflavimicrobium dichotomicum]SFJ05666.1 leucyl aminopeptidase [Thermoflavimicrobium dichotomicum]
MDWKITKESLSSLAVDAIVVFHSKEREFIHRDAREIDRAWKYQISKQIAEDEITGRLGEVKVLHNEERIPSPRVLMTGLGNLERINLSRLRNAVAIAARKAKTMGLKQLGVSCPSYMVKRYNSVDVVQAIVEGIELGTYRYHTDPTEEQEKKLETIWLSTRDISDKAVEIGVERGRIFAQATNLARYLTQEPANRLNPESLADYAEKITEKRKLSIQILEKQELERRGLHALAAFSKGSAYEPRMIVLSYQGAPDSHEVLGLVGKGVTFNNGGFHIQKGHHLLPRLLHMDMAGAAAVLGAMDAISLLEPHCNVIAVIPACENMLDEHVHVLGDTIQTFGGKTVEIVHTDTDGRLVLAEGLVYAKYLGATKLVDVATLTSTVHNTFGHEASAMMTNDPEWGKELLRASQIAGERIYELPMYEEYEELLESEVADLKNFGGWEANSIQGGIFLKHFVNETPWVHIDITGTAISPKEKGVFVQGATGSTVRTLIQLAMHAC